MKKGSEIMEIRLGLEDDGEFCINAGDNVNVDGYILTVESTTNLSNGNFQVTFTNNSNIEFVYNNQAEDDLTGNWE